MKVIEFTNIEKNEINRVCMGDIPANLFKTKNQISMINKLYMNIDADIEYGREFLKEIDKKISSYRIQDINKKKYLENNINREQTIEKLVASKLLCYYCRCKTRVIYNMARDPQQWTLDRIDNNLPHENDNVIISCLQCNLQRRRLDKEKFLFTKQLKIVKVVGVVPSIS